MTDRAKIRMRGVSAPVELVTAAEGLGEGVSIGMSATPDSVSLVLVISVAGGPALAATLDCDRFAALVDRLQQASSRMQAFTPPQHEPEVRRP